MVAEPDDRPSRRARRPVLVLVAVMLVATAAAYLGSWLIGEDGQEAASTPTSAPTSTPTPSPTPTRADADPDPEPDADPDPEPDAISHTLGEPVRDCAASVDVPLVEPPDGGSYLEVTVLESGDLDVDQWVRSSTPLTALRLSVPADPLVGEVVVASDLRVSADGAEADVPTSLGTSPTVITLADVHQVHLTYRLSGAVLRSPSQADRALARTVALDLDLNGEPRREPATISFRGATALTVICDGGGAQVRCGRHDDTGTGRSERHLRVLRIGSWPCSSCPIPRPAEQASGTPGAARGITHSLGYCLGRTSPSVYPLHTVR